MAIFVIKTKSKLPKCVIVLVVNSLQENEYDFMPLQSMWKISKELMCLSIEWKSKNVRIPTVEKIRNHRGPTAGVEPTSNMIPWYLTRCQKFLNFC